MWLMMVGCQATSTLAPTVPPEVAVDGLFLERGGPGRLRYLGVSVVASAGVLNVQHQFLVEHAFSSNALLFVHGDGPNRQRWALSDHQLGGVPLTRLKTGQTVLDEHTLSISHRGDGTLRLFVGLFDERGRLTLEAGAGRNDGRDRLFLSEVYVQAEALPIAEVRTAADAITIDGQLDETAWQSAQVLELADSLGRSEAPAYPTRVRMLFDNDALYVAFEAKDDDISERFKRRDDPIYNHEAVELFLMPGVVAPAVGPYVELQASPTGVIFDASFTGPRQNMDVTYDAGQEVATQVDGTLNNASDRDEGWVSEWRVPFSSIRGVSLPPRAGDEWRMNLFRIEKHERGGQSGAEYTAWSPPRVGDFHTVQRFGRMVFRP